MRTVHVKELHVETFLPFGFYANMIDPDTEKIGAPPIEFFRDMLQLELGNVVGRVSFGICRVEPRDLIIDASEYHSTAGEGILPLDNEVLMHVAPATPPGQVPFEKIEVFRVPQGTLVVLRPGVWHHAAFTTNGKPANMLIALPERLYANDCYVAEFEEQDQIKIVE